MTAATGIEKITIVLTEEEECADRLWREFEQYSGNLFFRKYNVRALAKEAGADDYLSKPFDISSLEDIVKKYTAT